MEVTAALVGALRALASEETLVLFAHMVCPISTEVVFWEEVQKCAAEGPHLPPSDAHRAQVAASAG